MGDEGSTLERDPWLSLASWETYVCSTAASSSNARQRAGYYRAGPSPHGSTRVQDLPEAFTGVPTERRLLDYVFVQRYGPP